MKNFIFLPLLSVAVLCSCSAKNTAADKNNISADKTSSSQQQNKDYDIKGHLDKNGKVVITDMNFEKGSSEVPQESESTIKDLADYLKNNTSVTMNASCYTNEDGSPDYCIDLSKKRAKNISDKLKKYGVEENRINITGEGRDSGNALEESDRIEVELVH